MGPFGDLLLYRVVFLKYVCLGVCVCVCVNYQKRKKYIMGVDNEFELVLAFLSE